MKKYLYIKFVLAFFILGFIGFFTVALAGSSMAERHVESVYSNQLYREAKVESVEYQDTIEVVAVCTPKLLGRLEGYIWTD